MNLAGPCEMLRGGCRILEKDHRCKSGLRTSTKMVAGGTEKEVALGDSLREKPWHLY